MSDLKTLLEKKDITLLEITEHLRKLSKSERIEQVITLKKSHQIKLWELAEQSEPVLNFNYLVPEDAPPLKPFPFEGKNSLPLFTRFQKVFYRTNQGDIAGYNNFFLGWLIGWGYFVVEKDPGRPKELAINYMKLPKEKPPDWPEIKSNQAGLTRFVYDSTVDYLRWVSEDVVIGRAYRYGSDEMPNWFVLCRAW